jgi:hypothetical protein
MGDNFTEAGQDPGRSRVASWATIAVAVLTRARYRGKSFLFSLRTLQSILHDDGPLPVDFTCQTSNDLAQKDLINFHMFRCRILSRGHYSFQLLIVSSNGTAESWSFGIDEAAATSGGRGGARGPICSYSPSHTMPPHFLV